MYRFLVSTFVLLYSTFLVSQNNIHKSDVKKASVLNVTKSIQLAQLNYSKAKSYLLDNKDDLAFDFYLKSKELYAGIDSLDKVNKINIEIVSLLLAINSRKIDYNPFLKEYIDYAREKNNPNFLGQAYMQIGKSFYDSLPKMALQYFRKAEKEIVKTKNDFYHACILQNIGATYAHDKISNYNKALLAYDEAFKIFSKYDSIHYIFNIYTNKGVTYNKKKHFTNALLFFKKADSLPIKKFKTKNKEILYGYMADTYKNMGDYKKTIEYIDKQNVYKDILNEKDQETAIKEIEIRYNTEKNEIKILTLSKKLQNNYILLAIGLGLLIISIVIGILTYKNVSKKKKIIEQEKLLQTQKLETTLKEQELHEIDVMLETQEKERQHIANELHDNLGSMLTTLKLNFENLKRLDTSDKEAQLFEKTDALIEEAYQKVRNISHLKNLGVIGSEGLVIAVKKMAEKMSVLEKLHINVIPHGLDQRLENTLEVMLFRMIQELCTNIIKHSKATEVNIYLTQHSSSELNIIIEDNGKGFNTKTISESTGIGLRSIEKKVEQLNGTFTIDSIISKGTTIIIDLPI